MSARIAAVLVALLVVLGGSALVYYQQERSNRASNLAALGQPLFKGLSAAEVRAIRITEPRATLTLEEKAGRWAIAERGGFPADFGKVRDLALKGIELKVAQSEPIGDKDRARLELEEPGKNGAGTQIEFLGADAKPLGRLIVGRKYFKKEPENAARASADGRFVMRPEDPKTVYIVADALAQASAKSADWIEKTAFAVEKVKSLEVRIPGGESWRIERAKDDAGWTLAGARAGEKIDVSRANSASYSLSLLELADVAPADTGPATTGLDKPTLVSAATFDGLSYAIRIGRLEGGNHFVSFEVSGVPTPSPKPAPGEKAEEHAQRLRTLEERLAREKAMSKHVLLIPKAKLEDVLKKRSELLLKKEEKK